MGTFDKARGLWAAFLTARDEAETPGLNKLERALLRGRARAYLHAYEDETERLTAEVLAALPPGKIAMFSPA